MINDPLYDEDYWKTWSLTIKKNQEDADLSYELSQCMNACEPQPLSNIEYHPEVQRLIDYLESLPTQSDRDIKPINIHGIMAYLKDRAFEYYMESFPIDFINDTIHIVDKSYNIEPTTSEAVIKRRWDKNN